MLGRVAALLNRRLASDNPEPFCNINQEAPNIMDENNQHGKLLEIGFKMVLLPESTFKWLVTRRHILRYWQRSRFRYHFDVLRVQRADGGIRFVWKNFIAVFR